MEINEFITKFIELFDDLDPSLILPSTKFRDLENWDSIMGLSVIGMIDEEYGVEFNAEDMSQCQIIEDIYNKVKSKK